MDRDDMRDNIERAQAEGMVADYRRRFPDMAAKWPNPPVMLTGSPPCEAFALRPTIADSEVATCPACVEFGTICRPCRKARYEARTNAQREADSRALRFRIGTSVLLGFLVFALLIGLQARWDKECAAKMPGSRWNGDFWACEVRR